MAAPDTLNGTRLYIKIGDGEDPEEFAHPCLINAERGFTLRANTNDVSVPDCDNPDDPAWRELVKDVLSAGCNGAGILDAKIETIQFYTNWHRSKDAKNAQVWLGTIGYWPCKLQLTEWQITGERGNKIQNSITLESDGAVGEFTAGP